MKLHQLQQCRRICAYSLKHNGLSRAKECQAVYLTHGYQENYTAYMLITVDLCVIFTYLVTWPVKPKY